MKKKVLSLAVLMASVFTFGTMAQTTATVSDNNKTCTEASCPKADKAVKGQKGQKGNKDMKPNRPNPFEGINLTADQQTRLQAIRDNAKQQREAAKADQSKVEKGKLDKDRADRRADFANKRKDYLGKVKEVLTPDQYVVFLENCYVQQMPMKQGHMARGKMAKHDGKKGFKASKGQKDFSKKGQKGQSGRIAQNAPAKSGK